MLNACNYQLFAREPSILGASSFTRVSEINIPVQFKDELWVHPDDIIVGDEDGVVCVPKGLVREVMGLCAERGEQDERVLEAVKGGMGMGESLRRFR